MTTKIENTAETKHVVLSAVAANAGELSAEELEKVAGGSGPTGILIGGDEAAFGSGPGPRQRGP